MNRKPDAEGDGKPFDQAVSFRAPARKALRILWVLAVLLIIVGSLLPSESLAMQTLDRLPLSDKMEHLGMYGLIAFLPSLYERRGIVATAGIGAVVLGIVMEVAQLLTGWRDFEVADMAADTIGVCIGVAIGLIIRARLPVRPRSVAR